MLDLNWRNTPKDMSDIEAYCVKCKQKRIMNDPQPKWSSNGGAFTSGICPVCGTKLTRFGKTEAHDGLPKPVVVKKAPSKQKSKKTTTKKKRRSGTLVIVESPTKVKTISRYLGRGYKVMSSVGHVRDLLRSRLSVDVEHNFAPEYRVPNDKRKVVKELKAAGEKAKAIYLATDPDREGEAIAWHVQESAEFEAERTKRVVFQEITKGAIQESFSNPREIDMDRVDAQQARRILDRLVGYKLSPLLWRKVRGRLSAGRVQSVAVRLIVEREREIDAFVPEEYWSIKAELSQEKFRNQEPRPSFIAKLRRIDDLKPVLASKEDIDQHSGNLENAVWTVTDARKGTRKRRPNAPFTTSTLQQEASRKINFSTRKTMSFAQKLYEGLELGDQGAVGLITYIRTDSVTVAKEAQQAAREFIAANYGTEYAPKETPVYKTKGKSAQEAHEAIRPTSLKNTPKLVKSYLTRDQFRLYKLIWDRFIASQMASAIYDTVRVDVKAGNARLKPADRRYDFRASGSTLRFSGFLVLYEEAKPGSNSEKGNDRIPTDLVKNEDVDNLGLITEQHFTQPPPRFSEASLVSELDDNGIGRPSTYASIIGTILGRGYVDTEDRRLVPTEIGYIVTDLLVEYFPDVMSVDFTARMENDLDNISQGAPWIPVVDNFYQKFATRLEFADEAIEKIEVKKEMELVGRDCPLCGNPLVYREGRYGRFIGCSTFPKCRHTEQVIVKIGVKCPLDGDKGGEVKELRNRRGRIYYGCTNYPECEWRSWKRPLPQPCPNCGQLLVKRNQNQVECTECGERYPAGQFESVDTEDVTA